MAAFEISVNGQRRFVGDDGLDPGHRGDARCGFCQKGPPELAGLLVRNAAALCPECLRACVDVAKRTVGVVQSSQPQRDRNAPKKRDIWMVARSGAGAASAATRKDS
jgi:hypothetical protein